MVVQEGGVRTDGDEYVKPRRSVGTPIVVTSTVPMSGTTVGNRKVLVRLNLSWDLSRGRVQGNSTRKVDRGWDDRFP